MRIVIVDDDQIVCHSLELILSAQEDIEVVGTGSSGDDAVNLYSANLPDIILMDIQMPGTNGIDAARQIIEEHPDAKIVFLTTFSDDDYIVGALKLGARGYLIKQDVASIAPALRSVLIGHRVLEGEILEKATALSMSKAAHPMEGHGEAIQQSDEEYMPQLTERERDIVRLVADGLDNKDIADSLYISDGTVRNHISAILAKLGLKNRTQIAVFYYKNCMH